MKRPLLALLLIFALAIPRAHAQFMDEQDARLLATNVLFGGVTTGFGAAINKPKGEPFFPVFLKGFKYGCIGGALLYTGKKVTNATVQGNRGALIYGGWGSKLIHNAGLSIMENAALHRPVFSHYNLYVGFMRLEFDWQQELTLQGKIMPVTLGTFVYMLTTYDSKFDFGNSLMLGTPYMEARNRSEVASSGTMRGNILMYHGSRGKKDLAEHTAMATIYGLQSQEHYIFNTYFHKTMESVRSQSKVFADLSRYFYLDANLMDATYELGRMNATSNDCGFYNPYNYEAHRLGTNTRVEWCK